MRYLKYLFMVFLVLFFPRPNSLFSMSENTEYIEELSDSDYSDFETEYDSDSEDEEDYQFQGWALELRLDIPEEFYNQECLILFRGIHFLQDRFSKQDRSAFRKHDFCGQPISSLGLYECFPVYYHNIAIDSGLLEAMRVNIAKQISSLTPEDRFRFQQIYTNQFYLFREKLERKTDYLFGYLSFSVNPFVSTSEDLLHALKYAFGLKNFGKNAKLLEPEYGKAGDIKHPYLGKVYIIIIPVSELEDLDPFFVVDSYANNKINVSTNYSNNILIEREVSFPGLIPGKYVVGSINARIPSLQWEDYPSFYKEKHGINKMSYSNRATRLRNGTANTKSIITGNKRKESGVIPNIIKHLKSIIKLECEKKNISIVYKGFNNDFVDSLPHIEFAKKKRNLIH